MWRRVDVALTTLRMAERCEAKTSNTEAGAESRLLDLKVQDCAEDCARKARPRSHEISLMWIAFP